jgi:hypothetical protein
MQKNIKTKLPKLNSDSKKAEVNSISDRMKTSVLSLTNKMNNKSETSSSSAVSKIKPVTKRTAQKIDPVDSLGEGSTATLVRIFDFMKKTREEDIKRIETEDAFKEEKKNEEERQHNEFIKVLKAYTKPIDATQKEKDDETGGFFDSLINGIKKMFSVVFGIVGGIFTALKTIFNVVVFIGKVFGKIMGGIFKIIQAVSKLFTIKNLLSVLGGIEKMLKGALWLFRGIGSIVWEMIAFLGGTVTGSALIALAAVLAPWMMTASEREKIRRNPNAPEYKNNAYAMVLRGEAKTEAQAGEINTARARKQIGRTEIDEAVKGKLTDSELKEIYGEDRAGLTKWLQNNPNKAAMYQAPMKPIVGTPEYDKSKQDAEKDRINKLKQERISQNVGTGKSDAERQSAQKLLTEQGYQPGQTKLGKFDAGTGTDWENIKPVETPPPSSQANSLIKENLDLNLDDMMGVTKSKPIISSQVNNTSKPAQPISAPASQRDTTEILDWVFRQSRALV